MTECFLLYVVSGQITDSVKTEKCVLRQSNSLSVLIVKRQSNTGCTFSALATVHKQVLKRRLRRTIKAKEEEDRLRGLLSNY